MGLGIFGIERGNRIASYKKGAIEAPFFSIIEIMFVACMIS